MMDQILLMQNSIQPYAWGSHSAIAELTGLPGPGGQPQAELWMGAHPKSPSQVWYQGQWLPLDEMIEEYPLEMLGARATRKFGRRLPYLFKVLAVDKPLSIQAHPDKNQAAEGFKRENEAGIALNAYNRNFKDDQHKPECICALTTFWAMCGFLPAAAVESLVAPVWPDRHAGALQTVGDKTRGICVRSFLNYMLELDVDARRSLIDDVVARAVSMPKQPAAYEWILRLNEQYPWDLGVLFPLVLNVVCLQPGQALFLHSRQLHAYLEGLGIELMANSDNVLRGGLTSKHVDAPALLEMLDFDPSRLHVLTAKDSGDAERAYESQAEEFVLSVIELKGTKPYISTRKSPGPVIQFCVRGEAAFSRAPGKKELTIRKGQSVFIPDSVSNYSIEGDAKLYKAGVNY